MGKCDCTAEESEVPVTSLPWETGEQLCLHAPPQKGQRPFMHGATHIAGRNGSKQHRGLRVEQADETQHPGSQRGFQETMYGPLANGPSSQRLFSLLVMRSVMHSADGI
mmetsp:Transcript_7677/g.13595  ORF Transcript_7677/g.13595 Transcript_7677/m.13595 type:complete len:109 (-) Transcript_7677:134-460(-)